MDYIIFNSKHIKNDTSTVYLSLQNKRLLISIKLIEPLRTAADRELDLCLQFPKIEL